MRKLFLLVGAVSFLLSSCANPNIGQRVDPHTHFKKKQGSDIVSIKQIVIDYKYYIEGDNIRFNGTFACNEDIIDYGWEESDIIILLLWFLDENNDIVAENRYLSVSNANFCNGALPKLLVASYPYADNYRGIRFGYTVMMNGF
jgi:hypothetical protein